MGQTCWPTDTAVPGSIPVMPALVMAARKASLVGSACAGAAEASMTPAAIVATAIGVNFMP